MSNENTTDIEVLEFNMNASPDEMLKTIQEYPLGALQVLDEAMQDLQKRAKFASMVIRLQAIKLATTSSEGETIQ